MTTATVRSACDVRALAPRERHPPIFMTCSDLAPGEALMRVNDHDPKPLGRPLQAMLGPIFAGDHVESGPETWRVLVRRNVT